MATQAQRDSLDIDEAITRIEKMQTEIGKMLIEMDKTRQDIKLAGPHTFFQGAVAMAALIGAGVALAHLWH
jgi:hypothetical protein